MGLDHGWFGHFHAGGIPGRGTTDLALAFQQICRRNLARGGYKTAATLMDIKGAFNAARVTPMMNAMQEINVPKALMAWTADFMSNRTLHPRRQGVYGTSFTAKEGLPQGSPVSPVLFSILLSGITRALPDQIMIYADDILIICKSSNHGKGKARFPVLQRTIDFLLRELDRRNLQIEDSKTELWVYRGYNVRVRGPPSASKRMTP